MLTSRALGGPLPTKMSWDVFWRFRRRGLLCVGTVEPRLWVAMLSERLEMMRGRDLQPRASASVIQVSRYGKTSRGIANARMVICTYGRELARTRAQGPKGRLRSPAADLVSD